MKAKDTLLLHNNITRHHILMRRAWFHTFNPIKKLKLRFLTNSNFIIIVEAYRVVRLCVFVCLPVCLSVYITYKMMGQST